MTHDFANRFAIKRQLAEVESTLRNAFECHMPPASALDETDQASLNDLLCRIRDRVAEIHDTLIPPHDYDDGQPDEQQEWNDYDPDC